MNQKDINKRRFIRFKFPYTINIIPANRKIISAYTEDISQGGINVMIKENLEVGSFVQLQIYLQKEPLSCKGRIAWIKEKENTLLEDTPVVFFNTGIELHQLTREQKSLIKKYTAEIKTI